MFHRLEGEARRLIEWVNDERDPHSVLGETPRNLIALCFACAWVGRGLLTQMYACR